MPLLVYVSHEKRQNYHHNFKAGALNVFLRVSGIISNAPYVLVLDCDMYCNDPISAQQAMCFYLEPRSSKCVAFVQFPQIFHNISNNDIYDAQLRSIFTTMWRGADGLQGPILSGTGFYIRREALYGTSLQKTDNDLFQLRKCFGPSNLGFLYHSLAEDFITGFMLHCKGWNLVYNYPSLPSFLGSATVSLNDSMVQNIRWGCGLLKVGLSSFCPLIYGSSRMSILQSMCNAFLAFRSFYSFPILCYATIPQLCLFNGISLYPKVSSPRFAIFATVYVSILSQHLSEVLFEAGSLRMWWNELRIWMIKSVTAYFFACLDVLMKLIGLKKANFIVTSKVVDEAQVERYKMGVFSFEGDPFFLVILVTQVTLNMVSFTAGLGMFSSHFSFQVSAIQ
ncbi:PREDICTED: cellulose synthase-like protein G2 [Nelumbo nucifera]|uniref:Cellulose synthase-like protein G2 n=2 Tax=Nelumbo nucifera TaxID=4432 RepID=A0A1U8Q9F0_NELNU|nr:PREDICTED: cellulose synthase-like protein G2 [Nelumbo nucifera]